RTIVSMLYLLRHHHLSTRLDTLSLHDALPISHQDPAVLRNQLPDRCLEAEVQTPVVDNPAQVVEDLLPGELGYQLRGSGPPLPGDRKSTRLNSSHGSISSDVFCLKKTIKRKIQ